MEFLVAWHVYVFILAGWLKNKKNQMLWKSEEQFWKVTFFVSLIYFKLASRAGGELCLRNM